MMRPSHPSHPSHPSPSSHDDSPVIVCLAHLAWDFVWQRPQHILSRLARHYPVLYINEPHIAQQTTGDPYLKVVADQDGVTAYQPVFPDRRDVLEAWREVYVGVVQGELERRGWIEKLGDRWTARRPIILWFYTPMPAYFLDHIPAAVIVYDVMDELKNFKHAPRNLAEREAQVLARADVVFTGGRSMYLARQSQHPNIHQFTSGVDPAHFAQALRPDLPEAAEIASLPHPRLGYYGVIDERLDLALLREVADARPDWSLVMVGPLAKIRAEDRPARPNIHYLGQQPYERLPQFLKGFDVCLMPFAMNEATRFISPTKTLEYMAAHKPIVSTPVPDVVANWGEVVYIAADPPAFIAQVERALIETPADRADRQGREEGILARSTWEHITGEMRRLIEAALAGVT
ncbi:MAG: glycosyltransferase [Anaerolineae bacterium]|nr:glycosyltransferase [Anaerolineae bacterium]